MLLLSIPGEVQASEVMKFISGGTNVSFGLVTKGYGDPIGSGETCLTVQHWLKVHESAA